MLCTCEMVRVVVFGGLNGGECLKNNNSNWCSISKDTKYYKKSWNLVVLGSCESPLGGYLQRQSLKPW